MEIGCKLPLISQQPYQRKCSQGCFTLNVAYRLASVVLTKNVLNLFLGITFFTHGFNYS